MGWDLEVVTLPSQGFRGTFQDLLFLAERANPIGFLEGL
jgi:hypothetical protein